MKHTIEGIVTDNGINDWSFNTDKISLGANIITGIDEILEECFGEKITKEGEKVKITIEIER